MPSSVAALVALVAFTVAAPSSASAPPGSTLNKPWYPPNHHIYGGRHPPSPPNGDPVISDETPSWELWGTWAGEIAAAAGDAKNVRRDAGSRQRSRRPPRDRRAQTDADIDDILPEQEAAVEPQSASGGGASQRLRADLLANYDRGSYPWETAWEASAEAGGKLGDGDIGTNFDDGVPPEVGQGSSDGEKLRQGLNVEVGINFHRVFDVNLARSTASLVVWFRQQWTDPRLAWNPANYSELKTVHFWVGDGSGPGGEMSEIWTPDLELWNAEASLADSLTDAPVTVDYNGTVFWSRPGHLMPVCKFSGLDDFPFDMLKCTVEIGSWSHSGLYIRSVPLGDGYTIGGSETAGESFAEYQLAGVLVREQTYPPFPGAQEEDWPVLLYDVVFHRSWQPYVRGYLVLQIILNLAAFACFWLPPHCGERMGLAITSMLASVTSELIVAASLPPSSEMTWFARFSLTSLGFSSIALFETAAVIFFFYCTSDDLTPLWMKWILKKRSDWKGCRRSESVTSREKSEANDDGCSASVEIEGKSLTQEANKSRGVLDTINENVAEDRSCDDDSARSDNDFAANPKGKEFDTVARNGKRSSICPEGDEIGSVKEDEFDSGSADTKAHKEPSDKEGTRSRESGRPQSPKPSSITVGGSPTGGHRRNVSFRSSLARSASEYADSQDAKNNRKWQRVANWMDDVSRLIFPLAYAIAVGTLLGPKR